MTKKYSFIPNWTEEPPLERSYRSIFKWGNPHEFKHPSMAWYAMMKEAFSMTDEDFRACSSHGSIKQEILIDEGGTFAALYVLAGKNNNRVYSIDGVITKISTSTKNRSFR